MAITIELTPQEEADLEKRARARGMALPEFVKLRALENISIGTNGPSSGENLKAMFARWQAEAEDTTPEEDAAYEQMQKRIEEGGVTMRRVDVTGCE